MPKEKKKKRSSNNKYELVKHGTMHQLDKLNEQIKKMKKDGDDGKHRD